LRAEARGRRVPRQYVDHAQGVADAAARGDGDAEYRLATAVMHPRAEDEAAALIGPVNRPAGEAARDLLNVLLRVATLDAQRVQLHQLARVVLVDVALALRRGLRRLGRLSLCGVRLWRRGRALGSRLPCVGGE